MSAPIFTVNNHPSDQDIVCMRGRAYWNHPGNIAYRQLIDEYKDQYAHASSSKFEKSLIVTEIIELAKEGNRNFVKKTKKGAPATTPIWVECSDDQVREKVSQSLRDGLSTMYKSATSSKKQRRETVNNQLNEEIERVIFSNTVIADKISELNHQISEMKAGNHPCTKQQQNRRRTANIKYNRSDDDDDDEDSDNDKQYDATDRTLSRLFDEANFAILETIKTDPYILSYSWVQ